MMQLPRKRAIHFLVKCFSFVLILGFIVCGTLTTTATTKSKERVWVRTLPQASKSPGLQWAARLLEAVFSKTGTSNIDPSNNKDTTTSHRSLQKKSSPLISYAPVCTPQRILYFQDFEKRTENAQKRHWKQRNKKVLLQPWKNQRQDFSSKLSYFMGRYGGNEYANGVYPWKVFDVSMFDTPQQTIRYKYLLFQFDFLVIDSWDGYEEGDGLSVCINKKNCVSFGNFTSSEFREVISDWDTPTGLRYRMRTKNLNKDKRKRRNRKPVDLGFDPQSPDQVYIITLKIPPKYYRHSDGSNKKIRIDIKPILFGKVDSEAAGFDNLQIMGAVTCPKERNKSEKNVPQWVSNAKKTAQEEAASSTVLVKNKEEDGEEDSTPTSPTAPSPATPDSTVPVSAPPPKEAKRKEEVKTMLMASSSSSSESVSNNDSAPVCDSKVRIVAEDQSTLSKTYKSWQHGKLGKVLWNQKSGGSLFLGWYIDESPSKTFVIEPEYRDVQMIQLRFLFYEFGLWRGNRFQVYIDGIKIDTGEFFIERNEKYRKGVGGNGLSWALYTKQKPKVFRWKTDSLLESTFQIHQGFVNIPSSFYEDDGQLFIKFVFDDLTAQSSAARGGIGDITMDAYKLCDSS